MEGEGGGEGGYRIYDGSKPEIQEAGPEIRAPYTQEGDTPKKGTPSSQIGMLGAAVPVAWFCPYMLVFRV